MKDINKLISIIIPVYNVEKYLKYCINSVINQSYKNIEIVLIDDGSTDSSGDICDEYLKKDSRIKVYHKKNGGLSSARNMGIEVSNGKYITFIDSDDDIKYDYVEYLYKLIKKYNTKMSICPYSIIKNKKIINGGKNQTECLLDTENSLKKLLCEDGFTVSACSKLYDKSLFNDVRFPINMLCEDNGTTYKLIMKCDYIAYGNESKYNYYKRCNSIMNSDFNIKKLDLLELTDLMCNDILKKYPDLINAVNLKKVNSRFSILRQLVNSKNEKKYIELENEIIKYLKSNKDNIYENSESNVRVKWAIKLLMINKKIFKMGWNLYSKIR